MSKLFQMWLALFKMHSILERDSKGDYLQIVILENMSGRIVAIDPEDERVKAKVKNVLCGLTSCAKKKFIWGSNKEVIRINYTISIGSLIIKIIINLIIFFVCVCSNHECMFQVLCTKWLLLYYLPCYIF